MCILLFICLITIKHLFILFYFPYLECLYNSLIEISRLVNAATGTGKTIAYLAPVINHLHKYDPRIERSAGTFGESILFGARIQF